MINKKGEEKIIFIGTSDFAAVILKALADSYRIRAVIARPDKPVGRHQILTSSPVKKKAEKYNLPILQPVKIEEIFSEIKKIKPDLIIVAAYGQIIPKKILDLAEFGSINIHASLLPKYRGASPIHGVLLAGDEITGVTIMLMDEKMDHGPILAQKKIKIESSDTTQILHDKLAEFGAKLLVKILPDLLAEKIKAVPQNHKLATYTKIINKDSGKINWQKKALEIERQIRAYYPWPGSWAEINIKKGESCTRASTVQGKRLKILKANILDSNKINYEAGELFLTADKKLAVACGQGSLILERVQLEGKKETSGIDFFRGYKQIEKLV